MPSLLEEPDPLQAPGARSDKPPLARRLRRAIFGQPRNLAERGLFHRLSLVALLAWVGLGADGLSSSAYGPEEAFRTLGEHAYLAVVLAVLMASTVLIISAGYSRIIDAFPHGGGGYVVASRLLGRHVGLVSGCALLVDYVLTITVSIAAAGDALFSLAPPHWRPAALPVETALIVGMTCLNMRGVRESIMILAPVFFLFVATHVVLIVGGIIGHAPELPETAREVSSGFSSGLTTLGVGGMALLTLHAFALGGGAYTGIEAVSNGVPIMRHPQARTAKRTMALMAVSLAFTATGLLVCYLLWDVSHEHGKTLNAVLVERVAAGVPFGRVFVALTLIAEAALLVVAAQAGFADGPRVLANMAVDSWAPRRFSALSERLTTQNGIVLMGAAALAALLYTHGDVRHLVVMYSINVFLTFSLSLLAMLVFSLRSRRSGRPWRRAAALFATGLTLCATILVVTVLEKFGHGGWVTLLVTGAVVATCLLVRRHYDAVSAALARAFASLEAPPPPGQQPPAPLPPPDPELPTAMVLVGGYSGIGVHTTLNALRAFPGHFKGLVFLSVGVIDSGAFKGEDSLDDLRARTQESLDRYISFAHRLGLPATSRLSIGADPVEEAEKLCVEAAREFARPTFIAGQVVFQRETWLSRLLHNQTAQAIQRRLQWAGLNMIILPARIR